MATRVVATATFATAVILSGCGSTSSGGGALQAAQVIAPSVQVCDLTTVAAISIIIGHPFAEANPLPPQQNSQTRGGTQTTCRYQQTDAGTSAAPIRVDIDLVRAVSGTSGWDAHAEFSKDESAKARDNSQPESPVPGLGGEAFFNSYRGELEVRKGDILVRVMIFDPALTDKSQLQGLDRAVLKSFSNNPFGA